MGAAQAQPTPTPDASTDKKDKKEKKGKKGKKDKESQDNQVPPAAGPSPDGTE